MLFPIRTHLTFVSRRLPMIFNQLNALSSSGSSDDSSNQKPNPDSDPEETTVASMIGPYVSSKKIAFHTAQFDSEQIEKKNKQAFLVREIFFFVDHHR